MEKPWENKPQLAGHPGARWGYIYLIWSSAGMCKIGRTKNLEKRLKVLKRRHANCELKLLYAFEVRDSCNEEVLFQGEFQAKRLGGEWFALNGKDIQRFCILASIREMQTRIESKFWNREEISESDSDLRLVVIDLPGGINETTLV